MKNRSFLLILRYYLKITIEISGIYNAWILSYYLFLVLGNMDFFDFVFGGGQAIQGIFRLGFIPKEEDFREFSDVEYQKFKEKECDICGKMYTFKSGLPIAENDVYVFNEEEKGLMLKGVEIIDSLCEEKTFISDDAKLRFVATVLPGVFSEGTKYACNEE